MLEELFGGRQNLCVQLVAVNRRLVTDTFRQKRRSGAIAGVDAAQCYDRIVHSLSILLCQKEGAPLSSLMMMFGVIQSMNYFIRTTFGDSNTSYGGKQKVPFQGSCQGNGASPAIWLILSMYLVLIMKEEGHNTTILSPLSGVTLVLIGFLFVDDTDLVVLAAKNEPDTSVYSQLQASINFWNGILRVTGGALKPEKCYWYFARFLWFEGQWELSEEIPPPIHILADDGRAIDIEYKLPGDATKAVGVWQDLKGSSSKQLQEMITKVRQAHRDMTHSPMPRHLNWIGLRQSIWKSIEYVLSATTFTKEEAALLAKELYRPLLPKLGCNRNFPLLLRYNSSYLLGLDLRDPYVEQGLKKLDILITHGGLGSMTGKFLQTSIEHHMLEIGSFTPFFSIPFKSHECLSTPTWLTVLWEFISDHDITLSNATNISLSPFRRNDRALMDIFFQDHSLSSAILVSINRVRCYLEVFSLADIATGDGTRLRSCYSQGQRGDTHSQWDWHEERPSDRDFKRWRDALSLLFDETKRLHTPLGKWLALPHHRWKWHYDMPNDIIYERSGNSWISYCRGRAATRTNPIYLRRSTTTTVPLFMAFTTVLVISEGLVLFEGTDYTDILTLPRTLALNCDAYWILDNSNIKSKYRAPWVTEELSRGTLLAVCDGSYKPNLAPNGITAAWVIENSSSTDKILGSVATSGVTADPYRGELLGIYALLSAISYIERYNNNFTSGTLRIACDNEGAGRVSNILDPTVAVTAKHFDIVKAIRRLHHSLATSVICYHLYGHQDNHTPYSMLPRDAQLNVLVDKVAQDHFDSSYLNNTFLPNTRFHQEGWVVSIGGVKLQDRIASCIRDWIGKKRLRRYLYEKDLIAWNVFPLIDLNTLQIHMSAQSRAYQLWFSKHWTGFCAIGSKMQQMKLWDNNLCPCCRQVAERSTTHLFLCQHPSMSQTRDKSFHQILDWLETVDTDPLLLDLLSLYWHGEEVLMGPDYPPRLTSIYQIMRDIGLHQMWQGFLPVGMVDFQQQYYLQQGSRRTGKQWGVTFVSKMIRATHGLWMERNNILHLRTANGVRGLCLISMRTAVEQQLALGHDNLDEDDYYLLGFELESLLKEPETMIRGWLCEILIARGDFASARLECLRDRGDLSHVMPTLTDAEMRIYLDWRNVQLRPRL